MPLSFVIKCQYWTLFFLPQGRFALRQLFQYSQHSQYSQSNCLPATMTALFSSLCQFQGFAVVLYGTHCPAAAEFDYFLHRVAG